MSQPDPLETFFKLPPESPPSVILGLRRPNLSDADVLAARGRKLEAIDAHPLASTPDADEARLAVHAAAAQLLRIPEHTRTTPPRSSSPLPSPKPRLGLTRAAAALERDTLLLVGMAGGWTPRVLTRLAALAITRGLSPADAVAAARRLAGSRSSSSARPKAPAPARSKPAAATRPTGTRAGAPSQPAMRVMSDEVIFENWLKNALVIGGAAGLALAVIILGALWALSLLSDPEPAEDPSTPAPAVAQGNAEGSDPAPRIAPARDTVNNADLVLLELSSARSLAQTNRHAEAAERVNAALEHWLGRWPTHDTRAWREVLLDAGPVIDLVTGERAGDDALARRLARHIPDTDRPLDASGVTRLPALAALHASLQTRSGTAFTGELDALWRSLGLSTPTSPIPAANGALRAGARGRLAPTPETYTAFADAAEHLARIAATDATPLLTEAASDILARVDPPTPGEREAIGAIVARLDWRSGSTARAWLLARLNDRAVHPARASQAIETLARSTSAPGIATETRLAPDASWQDRLQLSQNLAATWNLQLDIKQDLFTIDWLATSDELLAHPVPTDTRSAIEHLARLATLNNAALLTLSGADGPAVTAVARAANPAPEPDRPGDDLAALLSEAPSSDITVLEAMNNDDLLLEEVNRVDNNPSRINTADAGTLVGLAFRARSENLRQAAADAIQPIATSPVIIMAALKASPAIPDNPENQDLLASIASDTVRPAPGETFQQAAHRTLASALLARTDAPSVAIDAAANPLHDAYRNARHITPVGRNPSLLRSVRALTNARLASVPPALRAFTTPETIVAQRDTRLRVSSGPVQPFAIEQHALASASALAAVAAFPDTARPVETLWERYNAARNEAASALAQAVLTERFHTRVLSLIMSRVSPEDARRAAPRTYERALPTPPRVTLPPDDPTLTLDQRLQQLRPDNPAGYLMAGEELLGVGRERSGEHALVLALTIGAAQGDHHTAASAALALRARTDNPEQRQLLRALADTLSPDLVAHAWLTDGPEEQSSPETARRGARLLLDIRRGRGDAALEALRDVPTRELLTRQPELVGVANRASTTVPEYLAALARAWPCPECDNERTVRERGVARPELCPNCHADPGPRLSNQEQAAWLTVETRLLAVDPVWSDIAAFPELNEPVVQPSVEAVPRLFGVDVTRTHYRNSDWTRP
ncbi:MAG: hypothetical protein ACF8Q5_06505 [Phycisphaerales bacterium JB040]